MNARFAQSLARSAYTKHWKDLLLKGVVAVAVDEGLQVTHEFLQVGGHHVVNGDDNLRLQLGWLSVSVLHTRAAHTPSGWICTPNL